MKARISPARGWIQTNGLPFADTIDALFFSNAHLLYPLLADEFGDRAPSGQYVLTGTSPDGTTSTNTCVNWTNDGLFRGGLTGGGDMWTYEVDGSCFPYRPDDVRVADSTADLAAGNLWAPISVTADGRTEISNHAVWTGAPTPTTAAAADSSCAGWTSAAAASRAVVGLSTETDESYFDDTLSNMRWPEPCNFAAAHLYCLQE